MTITASRWLSYGLPMMPSTSDAVRRSAVSVTVESLISL